MRGATDEEALGLALEPDDAELTRLAKRARETLRAAVVGSGAMAELWDHAVALARDKHPLWGDKTVAAFVALTIASATDVDLTPDAAYALIVDCVDGPAPLDMALRVLAKKERQTAPGFVERRAVVVLERARDELARRAEDGK